MEITIGSKVEFIHTGEIFIVNKIHKTKYIAKHEDDWKQVQLKKSDCKLYVEPPKEKSFYDKMRERNMEDAKKLPQSPQEVGQHIFWLKMAVMDRIEQIENLKDDKLKTFRSGETFGFTEPYVNLLMHHAYEAGKKNATDSLTRHFNESTRDMKTAMDSIIKALDDNGLLPENNGYEY
jgi:hypothetical protein